MTKERRVAIRMEGGKGNTVTGNLVVGMEMLEANNQEGLLASGNTTIATAIGPKAAVHLAERALLHLKQSGDSPPELEKLLHEIRAELSKVSPEHGRLQELLTSARNVAEGATGNVVAAGFIQVISKALGV